MAKVVRTAQDGIAAAEAAHCSCARVTAMSPKVATVKKAFMVSCTRAGNRIRLLMNDLLYQKIAVEMMAIDFFQTERERGEGNIFSYTT